MSERGSTDNPMFYHYHDFLSMRGEANMPMGPRTKWRLYFNKREAAHLVCSIDNGHIGSEFAVQRAILRKVNFITTSTPNQARQERGINAQQQHHPQAIELAFCGDEPLFWIEFEAELELQFGVAYFDGYERDPMDPTLHQTHQT